VAGRLDEQLDDNVRGWLANPSLNQFNPSQGKAGISPIFKWYRQDFDAYPGGLNGFLTKYGPRKSVEEPGDKKLQIDFRNYDWGLNDQSGLGKGYTWLEFAKDKAVNWLHSL
jgi:hypothetical protein